MGVITLFQFNDLTDFVATVFFNYPRGWQPEETPKFSLCLFHLVFFIQ